MSSASRTTDAPPDPTIVHRTHKEILKIVIALVLCQFTSALSQTVVATALPTIVGELGGQDQLAWVASAMLLTMTVSTPLWGKLSDLYGRKRLMQIAVAIFVASSILAGLAMSMGQLIGARALQGIGAGGVIALSQATLGDIVSPRQRGRYAGYMGASFGIATVTGPLIGGFLVDGPGWRWTFYVVIPIAVVASIVLHRTLKAPVVRREHKIDWAGATLITAGASALLLLCSLGGQQFAWLSGWTLLLAAVAALSLAGAIIVERRVAEPILPPRLFRNPTFVLTCLAAFFVGFAMLAAMIYIPQYFQVVRDQSPTASGMLTLPLVLAMISVSIPIGRAITRWGRWKVYPLIGLLLIAGGAAMLSTIGTNTDFWVIGIFLGVFGTGLGFTMQVLTLAVQNATEHRDLGVATSASFFFRSMGSTVGVSVLGAVLVARLHSAVPDLLREHDAKMPGNGSLSNQLGTPEEIGNLSEPFRTVVREAYTIGLDQIYLVAVPLVLVSFIAILCIREVPLRTSHAGAPEPGTREQRATVSAERAG